MSRTLIVLLVSMIVFASVVHAKEQSAVLSKRLDPFYTQWINDFMKDKSYTMISAANASKASIEPDRTDFAFTCPGYSFLIGVASSYDKRPYDRMFRFICGFFENTEGEPIEKNSCSQEAKPYINVAGEDALLACKDNEIMHGLSSAMRPDEDQDDRMYKPLCCQSNGLSKTPYIPVKSACKKSSVSSPGRAFEFKCAANTAIVSIDTKYNSGSQDRSFSFTCCPLVSQE